LNIEEGFGDSCDNKEAFGDLSGLPLVPLVNGRVSSPFASRLDSCFDLRRVSFSRVLSSFLLSPWSMVGRWSSKSSEGLIITRLPSLPSLAWDFSDLFSDLVFVVGNLGDSGNGGDFALCDEKCWEGNALSVEADLGRLDGRIKDGRGGGTGVVFIESLIGVSIWPPEARGGEIGILFVSRARAGKEPVGKVLGFGVPLDLLDVDTCGDANKLWALGALRDVLFVLLFLAGLFEVFMSSESLRFLFNGRDGSIGEHLGVGSFSEVSSLSPDVSDLLSSLSCC
jgi:hypothetical protein